MRRRRFLATTAGAASVALAGCLSSGQQGLSADDYDIGMSLNAFLPDRYEISVGDTVVWGNTSSRAHSVTAYGNAIPDGAAYFASGGFDTEGAARDSFPAADGPRNGGKIFTGETYEHTFETPGEYHYFCIPHEPQGMVGTIVVRE